MLSEEAEAIAGSDPALAAILHADAAVTAIVAGDCGLALESAARGAAMLPERARDEARCHVFAMLGMGLAVRGRTGEAREAYDQVAELLPAVHPLSPSAQSTSFGVHARVCTGQERTLRAEALSLGSSGRDAGTLGLLPHYLMVAADAAYRLGEWAESAADADEAIAIADDSGQLGPLSIVLVVRGRLHAALGEEAEARSVIEWGMEIAEPPGYESIPMWGRAALGFMELGLGKPDAAIAELEQARRLADAARLEDPVIVPWASDLVEAYAHADRKADAREVLTVLVERASGSAAPLALALAARAEGLVTETDVEEPFERALEQHARADAPFETARTRLAYGTRLHRARRRVEAREQLRIALDEFERLGAEPWAERARAELRAAGAIRRDPVGDPDRLTAQEERIARAVARGATNREVAAEFFLSPKTIEFHLGRVYRKLGIHSRTELATLVAEGRLEPEHPGASAQT